MSKTIPVEEQEVTINLYPTSVDEYADVYSSLPYWTKRLEKLAKDRPNEVFLHDLDPGVVARLPRKWVKITPSRVMSEEKRKELADQLEKARKEVKRDGRV